MPGRTQRAQSLTFNLKMRLRKAKTIEDFMSTTCHAASRAAARARGLSFAHRLLSVDAFRSLTQPDYRVLQIVRAGYIEKQ